MIVGITGVTGFVGRRIAARVQEEGHEVRGISVRDALPPDALRGCAAIIHLAGEPVAQRWTAEARKRIVDSRIQGSRTLVAAIQEHPPQVLVSASATGYYGSRGDEELTETSPPGDDFLAR